MIEALWVWWVGVSNTLFHWALGSSTGLALYWLPPGLVGTVMLVLLALVLWGLFLAADRGLAPIQSVVGVVTGKAYSAANPASRIPKERVQSWEVFVSFGNIEQAVPVEKDVYGRVERDDPVDVFYVVGRILNGVHVRAIQPRRHRR